MTGPGKSDRRRALGAFLRAQRERLAPAAVGLAQGSRRRTPGLRREELAQLAAISATWVSWLEQGRAVSPSPAALARLALALQLSRAERAYLFELAGRRDPAAPAAEPAEPAPPAMVAAIDGFTGPAYLLDRGWSARAWNPAAARLFVGWLDRPGERNLLRFIFLEPAARSLICDWQGRARRVLAEFRADYSRHVDDPGLEELIEELSRQSALFRRAWPEQAVVGREGGQRSFNHPVDGLVTYAQATFNAADRPDFKLVLLTPAAPPARA
jgi:transcriptional regulator with XRE-family HTH domain